MTLTELRNMMPNSMFDKSTLQNDLQIALVAVDYLHKNKVVHTGEAVSSTPESLQGHTYSDSCKD